MQKTKDILKRMESRKERYQKKLEWNKKIDIPEWEENTKRLIRYFQGKVDDIQSDINIMTR